MIIIVKELESTNKINQELDIKYLIDPKSDLYGIDNLKVSGVITKNYGTVKMNLEYDMIVRQKCARTLKEVSYPLQFTSEALFSSEDNQEYDYILEDTIDLNQFSFAEILLEKEPFVYHESSNEADFDEPEKPIHPAFEILKEK